MLYSVILMLMLYWYIMLLLCSVACFSVTKTYCRTLIVYCALSAGAGIQSHVMQHGFQLHSGGNVPIGYQRVMHNITGAFPVKYVALPCRVNWLYSVLSWAYSEKTIFPFPSTLNGIWSGWQFCFRFWTKCNSIWFIIERKTVTTITSHSIEKEMEI